VLVEDRLFATLDATTRRLQLPGGESVLMTDTVGFVRKLPHQLVQAFASTLDVVNEGDLLVHVVDGSGPDPDGHIDAVRQVVREIGGADIPELLVFNKADRSDAAAKLAETHPGAVAISAATGEGVDELLLRIGDRLRSLVPAVELYVPYARGDVLAGLHRSGDVLRETPDDGGVSVSVRLDAADVGRYDEFLVEPASGPRTS
jgi:GTP-binding protein HflX